MGGIATNWAMMMGGLLYDSEIVQELSRNGRLDTLAGVGRWLDTPCCLCR